MSSMIRLCSTISAIILTFVSVSACAIPPPKQSENGLAIPLIKHYSVLNVENTISVDVLRAHVEYVVAKIFRGLENYEKNTGSRHPLVNATVTRKRSGVGIPLESYGDRLGWCGHITIGTPPVSFSVIFDTGSSDLVLPAAACHTNCEGHARWDPAKTHPHSLGKDCVIHYAQGSVYGDQYTDNVTIAGLTAKTQTLCAATIYPARLHIDKFPPDGAMGMAFPSLSSYGASPVLETLIKENIVTNKVFSVYLDSKGGELYIGGANKNKYTQDDFVDIAVNTQVGFWRVTVENFQTKGKPIQGLQNVIAIIDTGANFVIGDKARIKILHDALGGVHQEDGSYSYPCKHFPDVSFTFNGKSFSISASTHNIGPLWPNKPDTECWSGIVGTDLDPADFWSIGAVFLQNVYTSFDYGAKKVRFAKLPVATAAGSVHTAL